MSNYELGRKEKPVKIDVHYKEMSIKQNACENAICTVSDILFRPHYVQFVLGVNPSITGRWVPGRWMPEKDRWLHAKRGVILECKKVISS